MGTSTTFLIFTIGIIGLTVTVALPTCSPDEFHYEYTECDSRGGRWRVSVPNRAESCSILRAPVRGQKCEFTCSPGQYLDIQGAQECRACPGGTYSLGGGLRFDDWDHLPSGFAVTTESFSAEKFYPKALGRKLKVDNCTEAGWIPKGNYIASLAGGCSAGLIYSATLVKPGDVRFTYQHTDDQALFHFSVQNNECQTVADKDSSRWPAVTGDGNWKTISVSLKSGLNLLKWKTMGVSSDDSNFKKPILIKKIEITGVAYTSECTKCRNGTYSNSQNGSTSCMPCPSNFYSGRGAQLCTPCSARKYSVEGAAKCLPRPPCSSKDYFEYNSPCDANNQTQEMYKWVQPKVCRDKLPGAVPLPPSGTKVPCPPCNPGMEYFNGSCRFCLPNHFSDGSRPCAPCGASTAPVPGVMYKWWNNLPEAANISSACLSLTERGCSTKKGWVSSLDHIHSAKGHADDAYLVLSLKVPGFVGRDNPLESKTSIKAFISFVFELDCSDECSFFFMMQSPSGGTTVIETWSGRTEKQQYTYTLTKTEAVTFTWAYQKKDYSDAESGSMPNPSSLFTFVNDAARIYSVNVTNALGGGADRCQLCPKGATIEGCVPCPMGHYIDPNTTRCRSCPKDTVVRSRNPWGVESCKPCGPGLKADTSSKCVSNGIYTSPEGRVYDFTSLTGIISSTGTPLFTASGKQYFHYFNISLLGNNDRFELATCTDNITYFDSDPMSEVVTAIICRVTLIPPHLGDNPTVIAAQPASLGDVLVNITTDGTSLNMVHRMSENGFPNEDSEMDVHFTYVSEVPTAACRSGRLTIITLRCDESQKGKGVLKLPPRCPDGTCDGCNFHFLWLSRKACPVCNKDDYEVLISECVRGTQTIHYIPPKHCVLKNGSAGKPEIQTRACSLLPFWLEMVISACVGLGIVLVIMLIYCWKRNKKLEYKYCKLIESRDGKDGDLPGADSCGLDEEEDDEHYDAIAFKESKGKQLFKKIKFMAKKDADDPFESIQLTMKDNLLA